MLGFIQTTSVQLADLNEICLSYYLLRVYCASSSILLLLRFSEQTKAYRNPSFAQKVELWEQYDRLIQHTMIFILFVLGMPNVTALFQADHFLFVDISATSPSSVPMPLDNFATTPDNKQAPVSPNYPLISILRGFVPGYIWVRTIESCH